MHSTTVAVDLAKNVFELAVADRKAGSVSVQGSSGHGLAPSLCIGRHAACLWRPAAVRTTGHAGSAHRGMQSTATRAVRARVRQAQQD